MKTIKSIGRIAGYLAFFLLIFAIAMVFKFPTDAVVRSVLEDIRHDHKVIVDVRSIERYRVTGVELDGVTLSWDKARVFEFARLENVKVWVNPLPLLWGTASLKLNVTAYGGRLQGKAAVSKKHVDADIDIDGFNLAMLDLAHFIPGGVAEFATTGLISGNVNMHLVSRTERSRQDKSTGSIDLDINNFSLSGIKVSIPLMDTLEMDRIAFEPTKLLMELDYPSLKISQGTFKGQQIEVVLSGKMTLKKNFMKSNYMYTAKFKLGPEFDQKYGLALSLAAGQMNLKKDSQGYYRLDLRGMPSNPRIQQLRNLN